MNTEYAAIPGEEVLPQISCPDCSTPITSITRVGAGAVRIEVAHDSSCLQAQKGRQMTEPALTTLAQVDPACPTEIATAAAIREAALAVLPEDWRVLPDGRATHAVLAGEATARLNQTDTKRRN